MAFQSLPWAIQGATHPAPIARNQTAAVFGVPVAAHTAAISATTAGGGHGVIDAGDLAVTQQSTPAMKVNVALGRAIIRSGAASSLLNGCYAVLNDATVEVTIAASDPTNPRIDLIIVHQPDTNDGDASNVPLALAVAGTPAASPAVPALTAYKNCLVLAQVAVAAAATTIVTANITDKRTFAYGLGGIAQCKATQRPSGASLRRGLAIIETDTNEFLMYYPEPATFRRPWMLPWGRMGSVDLATSGPVGITSIVDVAGLTVSFTAVANRYYKFTMSCGDVRQYTAGGIITLTLADGSNNVYNQATRTAGIDGENEMTLMHVTTLAAGAQTVKVRAQTTAGTVGLYQSAVLHCELLVEDIGPSSSTPA